MARTPTMGLRALAQRARLLWRVLRVRRSLREEYDAPGSRRGAARRLRLGIVSSYPIASYLEHGYDWIGAYYNPLLIFDEVHYFQTARPVLERLDLGYPLRVHAFEGAGDLADKIRAAGVDVLRAYDAPDGELAIEAGEALDLPVVVSVH